MDRVLEFIVHYVSCLAGVFLGMWVGELIIGKEGIPIASLTNFVLAFIIAFILSVFNFISNERKG